MILKKRRPARPRSQQIRTVQDRTRKRCRVKLPIELAPPRWGSISFHRLPTLSGSHGLACGLFSCDLPCQQGGAQNRDPLQEEREPSTQGSPADRKKLPIKIH